MSKTEKPVAKLGIAAQLEDLRVELLHVRKAAEHAETHAIGASTAAEAVLRLVGVLALLYAVSGIAFALFGDAPEGP